VEKSFGKFRPEGIAPAREGRATEEAALEISRRLLRSTILLPREAVGPGFGAGGFSINLDAGCAAAATGIDDGD
jgi:hypothetical protein